jgi:hypothetical protein
MFNISINFEWTELIDRIQMSATPKPSSVLGSRRPINEVSVSDEMREQDIFRKDMMTVLTMNRDLEKFKAATFTELKLKKNKERSSQTRHEFVLIDVVSDSDARELLLYLIRNESFAEICNANGIKMNSKSRGDETRVVMDISIFYRFKTEDMKNVFVQRKTIKTLRLSDKKELIHLDVDESNAQEIALLNRYWSQKKKEYQAIILNQNKQKHHYENATLALQNELNEEKEKCRLLAAALSREKKKVLDTERRVAGQKGAGTRCLNLILYT